MLHHVKTANCGAEPHLMARRRTERRKSDRDAHKAAEARIKLARLEPGGSAAHPIEVQGASVIEVHALGKPCLACGHPGTRIDEHAAAEGLRRIDLACPRCGHRRAVFYRIRRPS